MGLVLQDEERSGDGWQEPVPNVTAVDTAESRT